MCKIKKTLLEAFQPYGYTPVEYYPYSSMWFWRYRLEPNTQGKHRFIVTNYWLDDCLVWCEYTPRMRYYQSGAAPELNSLIAQLQKRMK